MLTDDVRSLVGDDPHPRWNIEGPLGTPTVVTYSFPVAPASYDTDQTTPSFAAFSDAHQVHIREALDTWADASGLIFVEVPEGQGDIRFSMFDMTGLTTSTGNQMSGYAYYPTYGWRSDFGSTTREYFQVRDGLGGDVFLNSAYYEASSASIAPGQRGYSILLHEIGHAIGFEHPFSGEHTIDPARDNGTYTVMSYDRSRSTTELGSVDLEALEFLYGADDAGVTARYDAGRVAVEITGPDTATWLLAGWGGPNRIIGGSAGDTLKGHDDRDTLVGGAGDDSVAGAGGDDLIEDGAGNDSYDGGSGTDTLVVQADAPGIVVRASATAGSITRSGGDTDMFDGIEVIRAEGATGLEMIAEARDLHLVGGSGDDTLSSGFDRVTLEGGWGNDLLSTDPFAQATLLGGHGDDTLEGNSDADWLDGSIGNDMLTGGAGNDTLIGGAGSDAMDGGAGIDLADYATSYGRALVDLASDLSGAGFARFFYEGAGSGDTFAGIENVRGSSFADNLRGDGAGNLLTGGGASDRLYGRAGDDTLDGGSGTDAIYGNLGADLMTGGNGAGRTDRFIYFSAAETGVGAGNRDVITDFVSGEDRIEIRRIDADVSQGFKQFFDFIGDAAFSNTAGELRYAQVGGNTIVQADRDGDGAADFEIELTGLMDLIADDFLI